MLDKQQQNKRKNQIEMHRNRDTKRHQYPLRLSDATYQKLKQIAGDGTISDVINRGIKTEWIYYNSFEKFAKTMPHFDDVNAIEKWRLDAFKDSPELLNRYAKPAAILAYVKQLQLDVKSREKLSDNQATIAYLIRNIGNNINQLARRANQGGRVDKDALAQLTHAVIQLDETIRNNAKEMS
ncbi:plasmid mobilization relaxosome protein MobC [Lactobacillaceae bacterium Melli_B3]